MRAKFASPQNLQLPTDAKTLSVTAYLTTTKIVTMSTKPILALIYVELKTFLKINSRLFSTSNSSTTR